MEFWYFGQTGHFKAEFFKRKRDKAKDDAAKNSDREEKALAAFTKSVKQPTELALTASHVASSTQMPLRT